MKTLTLVLVVALLAVGLSIRKDRQSLKGWPICNPGMGL